MPEIIYCLDKDKGQIVVHCYGCETNQIFHECENSLIEPAKQRAEQWAIKHEDICRLFLSVTRCSTCGVDFDRKEIMSHVHETVTVIAVEKELPNGWINCESCNALGHLEDGRCLNCGRKFDYAR